MILNMEKRECEMEISGFSLFEQFGSGSRFLQTSDYCVVRPGKIEDSDKGLSKSRKRTTATAKQQDRYVLIDKSNDSLIGGAYDREPRDVVVWLSQTEEFQRHTCVWREFVEGSGQNATAKGEGRG
ncbi:hypothetical protein Q3G72_011632 [Acer saccharum]|nr:hypothetical protein Q3G72_011632 [Acer saccharum]